MSINEKDIGKLFWVNGEIKISSDGMYMWTVNDFEPEEVRKGVVGLILDIKMKNKTTGDWVKVLFGEKVYWIWRSSIELVPCGKIRT